MKRNLLVIGLILATIAITSCGSPSPQNEPTETLQQNQEFHIMELSEMSNKDLQLIANIYQQKAEESRTWQQRVAWSNMALVYQNQIMVNQQSGAYLSHQTSPYD